MKRITLFLMLALLLGQVSLSSASVVLNEVFADPAADLRGDANGDGVRSGSDDEFVELLNFGSSQADISGWSLADSVSVRHVFPANTILSPYTFLAIFGGGTPALTYSNWQVASTGTLSLNNTNDMVSLFNSEAQLIDQVVYGSIGGNDQSISLFPDGEGSEFVLHSSIGQTQGALFSPGTSVDSRISLVSVEEEQPQDSNVVPELSTFIYFGIGWASLLLKQKIKNEKIPIGQPSIASCDINHRLRGADQIRV